MLTLTRNLNINQSCKEVFKSLVQMHPWKGQKLCYSDFQKCSCVCASWMITNGSSRQKKNNLLNNCLTGTLFTDVNTLNSNVLFHSEKDIYNRWKTRFQNSKCYNEAVFVLGPMGSGKTTVINSLFRKHKTYKNFAFVDTDEIMEELAGFNENTVNFFYPIARRISIDLTDWLLEQNISFVAEGTCVQYEELKNYMIRLKSTGYQIKVHKIDYIPMETALQRASNRKKRRIDSLEVKNIYINSMKGMRKICNYNTSSSLFQTI